MLVFEENPLTKKYLDFYYFKVSYIMNKKKHFLDKNINEILPIKTLNNKEK